MCQSVGYSFTAHWLMWFCLFHIITDRFCLCSTLLSDHSKPTITNRVGGLFSFSRVSQGNRCRDARQPLHTDHCVLVSVCPRIVWSSSTRVRPSSASAATLRNRFPRQWWHCCSGMSINTIQSNFLYFLLQYFAHYLLLVDPHVHTVYCIISHCSYSWRKPSCSRNPTLCRAC